MKKSQAKVSFLSLWLAENGLFLKTKPFLSSKTTLAKFWCQIIDTLFTKDQNLPKYIQFELVDNWISSVHCGKIFMKNNGHSFCHCASEGGQMWISKYIPLFLPKCCLIAHITLTKFSCQVIATLFATVYKTGGIRKWSS